MIGTPVDGGGAGSRDRCTAGDDNGADGGGATADSADAAATSEITGAKTVGRAGTPPNPGKPNYGSVGRPSSAESQAPWSARWWLTAVIWSWRPAMACVSAWSASAVDMGWDAAVTVGTRVLDVPTIGSNTADCGMAEAGTPVVGAAEEGGTVVDESPDVAMVSDTRLVRRRDLLRRKYGGDRGARERVRVRPTGAVIVIAAARGDDEQEDAGRPRVTCSHNPRLTFY